MSLAKTIKAMVDDGYMISFSKEDIFMNSVCITIKKMESTLGKLFQKTNWNR